MKLFSLEPVLSKLYKMAWAPIKDSDQTVHLHSLIRVFDLHSLIRVFDGRLLGSQGFNVSSGGN